MRAVPADQVRFHEAIEAYTATPISGLLELAPSPALVRIYLLSNLAFPESAQTQKFTIHPSLESALVPGRSAFITPVDVLVPVGHIDAEAVAFYAGQAIAAILSLATERIFVSPRDDRYVGDIQINEGMLTELAIQFNVVVAGPGAVMPRVSPARMGVLTERVQGLVRSLEAIDVDKRRRVLQAARLHHLAQQFVREDFELGFALIVASIEAMAGLAISRESVFSHLQYSSVEEEVRAFCESRGGEVGGWFKMKIRDQALLKKKFVIYIMKYAPVSRWEEVRHSLSDLMESRPPEWPSSPTNDATRKAWFELYPDDLSAEDIEAILARSYDDRSVFLHTGARSSHQYPTGLERFFTIVDEFDLKKLESKRFVVANFETMLTISRIALEWFLVGDET